MKDTQQHLLIQDLDYCNIVCDDAEEIIGGGFFKKLFSAVRGEIKDTWNAIRNTGAGIVRGNFPDEETAKDLFGPLSLRVLDRLF
jgi:hypothetical protein